MRKYNILVIEDTKSIREELRDILSFEGMQVFTAENGQEGIDKAKEHLPDLILCDIMMPLKNGFEVFATIQNINAIKHTPFIFLTAKATVENIREGMILGVDDYITKPFDIDLLIKSVKSRLFKEKKRKQFENNKLETLQHNISFAIPHELLTPLNGIIGLSGLMKDPEIEIDKNKLRDFAVGIFDSGNRLLSTLQKFIYYTEVELLLSNDKKKALLKEKITETGEHELEEQSQIIAQKFNRESDIELHIKSFNIKISSFHFDVIIVNIIDNAFKFSNKGDKVIIEVELDDSHVYITVIDNGVGFNEVTLNQIGAFTQFNRSKMEQQGLGLGLITSKKLINFYEGELIISENKPKGSRVELSFLLAE
ncbi:hybrid two-component sensor histidine kinase/response regulator [Psychroflexus torquis ATCC 700755]|uniref:histidine kinase n=1 Tax=Psychroflexus torquis (strain ATCC 700755 / CIP 106069 / ACAM 623) TaxID=313595 RepID=K4IYN7_PSYTT|nr:response regulator [Psychroflexus torquis]AFU70580.1 hybrid two-component sensor histidine kinase/response regulator [Psychroflexus torquis ATCC 700755]